MTFAADANGEPLAQLQGAGPRSVDMSWSRAPQTMCLRRPCVDDGARRATRSYARLDDISYVRVRVLHFQTVLNSHVCARRRPAHPVPLLTLHPINREMPAMSVVTRAGTDGDSACIYVGHRGLTP